MKTKQPKIIIMSGYGLNCEEETKYAFEWAGGVADIVHINDLITNPKLLSQYDILAFPGGFSYGDDTGSGKAYANKLRNHLQKELDEFIARDTLVIGICNGFQIITNLGLVPGALAHNTSGMYIDRWVDMTVPRSSSYGAKVVISSAKASAYRGSPWLKGIKEISLPIAHGEGNYVVSEDEYKEMTKNKQIAFRYTKGEICTFQDLPANPNGAVHDIAGVLSENGRILGMMPHPERGMFFAQRPDAQLKKEIAKRSKRASPSRSSKGAEEGPGLIIFKNAIKYFNK